MTAKKAKWLLQFVPRDKFITGRFTDEKGKCCAVGHLTRLTGDKDDFSVDNCNGLSDRAKQLSISELCYRKAREFLETNLISFADLAEINNRPVEPYNQDHPKDRVMALLNDMIEAGY